MRYCINCGKKLEERLNFCPYCGAKQDEEAEVQDRKPGVWLPAFLILVIMVLCIWGFLKNRPVTLYPENYVDVFYEGYDGYGRAYTWFNNEAFNEDVAKALQKKGIISSNNYSNYTAYPQLDFIREQISFDLDGDSKLSNGDDIHLNFHYDNRALKKYKIRFSGRKIAEKVYGLAEAEMFDPFEQMEVYFEGYSTYGHADIYWAEENYNGLSYTIDKEDDLKNGDVITVTVSPDQFADFDSYVPAYGKMPSLTEQKYEVAGLEEIREFDPFEGLIVSFQGSEGEGTAAVDSSALEDYCLKYTLSREEGLSNGDKVTVQVSPEEVNDFIWYEEAYGMRASRTSCEYEVSGLAF